MSGPEHRVNPTIAPALELAERVRLMRDGVVNNSSFLISGLVSVFLVPMMLKGLGAEAYGFWIAMISVSGMVGLFDFGFALAVTRQLARSSDDPADDAETGRFLRAVGSFYFLLAAAGAVIIAVLGVPLVGGLRLSLSLNTALAAFVLVGVAFFTDRVATFSTSVLRGLRRFEATNGLDIISKVLRAFGLIALLWTGAGLLWVAAWHLAVSILTAIAGLVVVGRCGLDFRVFVGSLEWKLVRGHLPFSLACQLSSVAGKITWDSAPILVGLFLGSGSIAVYYTAQAFPATALLVFWHAADTLFPAVVQHSRSGEFARAQEVLDVGTRWIAVLAVPSCLILGILAPDLLKVWVGEVTPEAVLVLRLITIAAFADSLAAAPVQLLWGRGAVRPVLVIVSFAALASACLSIILLPRIGLPGAALGILMPAVLGSVFLLKRACSICDVTVRHLAVRAFRGFMWPTVGCLAALLIVGYVIGPIGWAKLIAGGLAGGTAFVVTLYFGGAREEERHAIQSLLRLKR